MRSSVLSSRGVRPFYILTAPDDYILSLSLSARLYVRVSALHPRRESRIPSERSREDTPLPLLLPLFISSDFSVLLAGGPSASSLAGRSPRPGETERTPRGWCKMISQAKGRKEELFQLNTPPPRLRLSLLGVGRSWNSAAVLSAVCWKRLEFAEFLGVPLHSLRGCAFPSTRALVTPVWAPPLQNRQDRIKKKKKKI